MSRRRPLILPSFVVTLATFACTESPTVAPIASPVGTSSRPSSPPLPAAATHPANEGGVDAAVRPVITGTDPFVSLAVHGFADAIVSVPIGRPAPAPIVVAGHGNYDRPEWQCAVWREILNARAFVLCPRGIARSDSPSRDDIRFTYSNADRYHAEVEAGLAALRERFGDAAAAGPIVYGGFSLAALFGAKLVVGGKVAVERAVFVEGGHSPWSAASAKAFARLGGKRVLFACGQSSCEKDSERVKKILEREKIEVAVVAAPKVGHAYDGPVARLVAQKLSWLLEGDARFGD